MSKRKIVLLATALCMVAILAVGGTLAYFTDTDKATNTFTVGGVKIDLIEQQSSEDGKSLVEYVDGQILMPIVGSAQNDPKNDVGQPTSANYIDKIVTIKNTGKSAAWVRAYFAIPSALDNGYSTFAAGQNILHFNFGNEAGKTTAGNQWIWNQASGKDKYFEMTLDGVAYNVYFADYYQPLAANATTVQFVSGVYLDSHVDMDANGNYFDSRDPVADLSILKGEVKCPVFSVAVQADGFADANSAIEKAFGAQYNPWAASGATTTFWYE